LNEDGLYNQAYGKLRPEDLAIVLSVLLIFKSIKCILISN